MRLRLPLAIVAVVVVAEATVLLMRPRERIEPVDVSPRAYFSEAQLERAEDYRTGQWRLYGLLTAAELALLVVVVRRPPRLLARDWRRPVLAGAAAAAAVSVAVTLVALPARVAMRERAKDVGLVTQDWVGYAGDFLIGLGIEIVLTGAGGALLVFGMRRFGRRWWAPGAVVVAAFGVVITFAGPVVLNPLFNRFEPLPDGPLRTTVLDYAREAGVKVGQVYEMDASRRTTAANAYVAGLGETKRVVLYDTLLRDFSRPEVEHVVAHELAHVRYDDLWRGLLFLAIVAPFAMFAVARLGERFSQPGSLGTAAAVPGVVLAIALVTPAVTIVSNQLSRDVEARADRFALELTGEPETQVAFQRRIALKNVADPDPPGWVHFLLGTHPTTMQRIGQALAFERLRRDGREALGGPRPPGGS